MVFTGNADVAAGLARWADEKNARTFYDVLRRCARGELLYDITGSELTVEDGTMAAGSSLGLRTHAMDDGSHYLLVFTSDAEIARAHPPGTRISSLVQPAIDAVQFGATEAFAGVILDAGAGPASCIITAEEIRRGLPPSPGVATELKDALAGPSLPDRRTQTLDVLTRTPVLYIPVQHIAPDGSAAQPGGPSVRSVPTAAGPGGRTLAAAFTSPAEVWAWLPEAEAFPTTIANVVEATLRQEHYAGLIVNPVGPPLIVTRTELENLRLLRP